MKLTPCSRAPAMMRAEVGSSVGPPNIMAPRQSFETLRPLRPSARYSIVISRDRVTCDSDRWPSLAPWRRLLIGMPETQHCRIIEGATDDLQRKRQAIGVESAANRMRGLAGQIEGHAEIGLAEIGEYLRVGEAFGRAVVVGGDEKIDAVHGAERTLHQHAAESLRLIIFLGREQRAQS